MSPALVLVFLVTLQYVTPGAETSPESLEASDETAFHKSSMCYRGAEKEKHDKQRDTDPSLAPSCRAFLRQLGKQSLPSAPPYQRTMEISQTGQARRRGPPAPQNTGPSVRWFYSGPVCVVLRNHMNSHGDMWRYRVDNVRRPFEDASPFGCCLQNRNSC
ncbi:hypothetical protein DPEC_G00359060 [Dallia pectoralis]|uniref:Uncharacterized protein n=1 Tax=Dallia pectoralis TaxID=75939 RepID=A0ACC2F0I3_DALPE|nr:hypothetical protein DPEC_G00359060 [Dallia pectoralis]